MRLSYLTVLIIILLPILIFFHTRGVITHDEGYILNSAEKLTEGIQPYGDFRFVYTPGSILLTALSFNLLGVSILSSRILMIILSVASCILIYKCLILSTRNKLYATLAVIMYVAWGPTHLNFSWPVMFCIPASLFTCYLALKFLETRLEKYLFLTGLAAFSVFLFKQNFGLAILIPFIAFFLVKSSRNIRYLAYFSYGYMWGIIGFVIYLLVNGIFDDSLSDFYFYTIKWIIINGNLSTGFIYEDSFPRMVMRTLFYLIPIVISLFAFILLYIRRRFHLLFLPLFTATFYIFGIQPTTDYVHLVPLLSLIGIPLGLILRYNVSLNLRYLIFLFILVMYCVGFYTALHKGYYRWEQPLIHHDNFYKDERVNIFVNDKIAFIFDEIKLVVNDPKIKSEYMYVDSFDQILYFITNTKEPTRDSYLSVWNGPKEYYDSILGNLVAKEVKIIIIKKDSLKQLPIQKYIKTNYTFKKTVQDFDVYTRLP